MSTTGAPRVTKRTDRDGYRATWYDNEGKRRRKDFRFKWQADAFVDQGGGDSQERPPTLRESVDRWQDSQRVSASRRKAVESLARNHLGELGAMRVDEILVSDVRKWMASVIDKGLSPKTCGDCMQIVRAGLESAIGDRHIQTNPAKQVKPPTLRKRKLTGSDFLTEEELQALIELAPIRWKALIAFRGYIGSRWSETIALRAGDFDLDYKTVHLGHRVIEEVNGVTREKELGKTEYADRDDIAVPAVVRELLLEHVAHFPVTSEDQRIFRTESGGMPSRANFRQRGWLPPIRQLADQTRSEATETGDARAIVAANKRASEIVKVPMKNLRHTAATMMLMDGVHYLDVAHRLGHQPSETLNTYARFMPKPQVEDSYGQHVTERFNARLKAAEATAPKSGS